MKFLWGVHRAVLCSAIALTGCASAPNSGSVTNPITTFAGNGTSGYSGDGAAATSAELTKPYGLATDSNGNVFIADGGNVVRKVTSAGVISTVAGTGTQGYSGDGGAAASAQLASPRGVAVDSSGNVYVADTLNNVVRKVTAAGVISTYAGNGVQGYSGNGGAATSAELDFPYSVAVDSSGNLYIADSGNNWIRKVSAAGIISTVAGSSCTTSSSCTVGSPVAASSTGDGGAATSAKLSTPYGVALDRSGNLYIADTGNNWIREVNVAGVISHFAGASTTSGSPVAGYSGDGGAASVAALNTPYELTVDANGNVYVADGANFRVREISAAGVASTVAGDGYSVYGGDNQSAASASLTNAFGVAVDAAGNLYIADGGSYRVRKVTF